MNKEGRARKVKYDLTPRPSPPADVGSEGAKYVILCFLLQLTMVSKQTIISANIHSCVPCFMKPSLT